MRRNHHGEVQDIMQANGNDGRVGTSWEQGERLERHLRTRAPKLGLTERAIARMVTTAKIHFYGVDQPIFDPAEADGHVYFVNEGYAQLRHDRQRTRRRMLAIVPAGQFLLTGSFNSGYRHHAFAARMHHAGGGIATWPQDIMTEVMGMLPPANSARFVTCPWRGFSALLDAQVDLDGRLARERLLLVFRRLARTLGEEIPGRAGRRLRVKLTRTDMAELAGVAIHTVSHAKQGIDPALVPLLPDGHYFVTERALTLAM